MDIARYFHEVEVLVLHLRDEGHCLSPEDLAVLEAWWDACLPLDPVLRGVRRGAARLAKRRRRVRGMRLRAVAADVAREVKRAGRIGTGEGTRDSADGADPDAGPSEGAGPGDAEPVGWDADVVDARKHAARVAAALLAEAERVEVASPDAAGVLRVIAADTADLGPERAWVRLLEASRTFYDLRLDTLADAAREEAFESARAAVGPAARRMRPEALSETLRELARRRLRDEDPVLDPDRMLEVLP